MLTSPAGKTDVCLKCWHSVKKLLQGSPDSQSLHICSSHSFQVASWCSTSIQKFRSNSNLELDLPINANNYSVCIKKLRMLYRKKERKECIWKAQKSQTYKVLHRCTNCTQHNDVSWISEYSGYINSLFAPLLLSSFLFDYFFFNAGRGSL